METLTKQQIINQIRTNLKPKFAGTLDECTNWIKLYNSISELGDKPKEEFIILHGNEIVTIN